MKVSSILILMKVSGKGTSHHTNGILIQTCEHEADDQGQEKVNVPVIKKGVRVFSSRRNFGSI